MLPSRWNPWRGIVLTLLLFGLEFWLHIVFASMGWEILFLLVVIDLFIICICFAPVALILGGPADHVVGQEVIKYGTLIAVPLTMGIFWAVNDMQWSNWLIGSTGIPLVLQIVWFRWERSLSGLLYGSISVEEE